MFNINSFPKFSKFIHIVVFSLLLMNANIANASDFAQEMNIYKSPSCGCCSSWGEAMINAGYKVKEHNIYDLESLKDKFNIPSNLRSCHTAIIDGYIFEGHVPLEDVNKFLQDKPNARGLSTPGMPIGSLGMEMGSRKEQYEVIIFNSDNKQEVYSSHN